MGAYLLFDSGHKSLYVVCPLIELFYSLYIPISLCENKMIEIEPLMRHTHITIETPQINTCIYILTKLSELLKYNV